MKEIQLTRGQIALVNDEDFEMLSKYTWHCKNNKHTKYAFRCYHENGKTISVWMHREVLGISNDKSKRGDHIDFNGLNNTRENLRVATHKQNNCYKNSAKNSRSKYLGVSFCKCTNKWMANITNDYKQIKIGRFESEVEAAMAYNYKAYFLHGEFANLNILPIT